MRTSCCIKEFNMFKLRSNISVTSRCEQCDESECKATPGECSSSWHLGACSIPLLLVIMLVLLLGL